MSWKDSIQEPEAASWKDTIEEPVPDKRPAMDLSAEGLGRSLTEAIPLAGGLVGGVAGGLAGPLTGVAGAGAGYAAGGQVRDLIKQYILKDKMESKGVLGEVQETAGDLIKGGAYEAGGMVAGTALKTAAPYVKSGLDKTPAIVKDLAIDAVPFGNTAKRVIESVMKNKTTGPTVTSAVTNAPEHSSMPAPAAARSAKPVMSGDEIFKVRRFKGDTGAKEVAPGREAAIDHFLDNTR